MKLGQVVEYLIAMILIKYSIQKFGLDTNFRPLYIFLIIAMNQKDRVCISILMFLLLYLSFLLDVYRKLSILLKIASLELVGSYGLFFCLWIEFFIKIFVIKCCSSLLVFDRKCILCCMSIKYVTLSNSVFKNINKIQSIKIIKTQMVLNPLFLKVYIHSAYFNETWSQQYVKFVATVILVTLTTPHVTSRIAK